MFQSGDQTGAVGQNVNFNASRAAETDIPPEQYVLVVFVITIVVVSSVYFLMALALELSNSCSHYFKVVRSRKQNDKGTRNEASVHLASTESLNDTVFEYKSNPLDTARKRDYSTTNINPMWTARTPSSSTPDSTETKSVD